MKRRIFLKGAVAAGLGSASLTSLARAQAGRSTLMKFVPQANLSTLDPIWTTAAVTNNHGYYVFDTLFGAEWTSSRSHKWPKGTRC